MLIPLGRVDNSLVSWVTPRTSITFPPTGSSSGGFSKSLREKQLSDGQVLVLILCYLLQISFVGLI